MIKRRRTAAFKFKPFSEKQLKILTWWRPASGVSNYDGIIADGAIRSGKTLSMALSFVLWSMESFNGEDFIMAGKTIGSFRRNVLKTLKPMLFSRGYRVEEYRGENLLVISNGERWNQYYIFGGRDERSQDPVQGMTAAGAFFDEVALMPESFLNQATSRCSVDGAKLWFNCNPAGPLHYFKRQWIDRADELKLLHLHFELDDNLSLSERVKDRYKSMYTGVFYLRYIQGLWAVAEGLIYSMYSEANDYTDETRPIALTATSTRYIAVDYGTTNPCVFLDIRDDGRDIWIENEWRWDSKSEAAQRSGNPYLTDAQYADAMAEFMGREASQQCQIVVDPSAKSFITELKNRGYYVKEGDNEVLDGIRDTSSLMYRGLLHIHERCEGLRQELRSYVWDDKATQAGEEKPVKMQDHGPDALRYYVNTILPKWRKSAA